MLRQGFVLANISAIGQIDWDMGALERVRGYSDDNDDGADDIRVRGDLWVVEWCDMGYVLEH